MRKTSSRAPVVGFALIALLAVIPQSAAQKIVTTVAGGFVGDGASAKSAALSFPAYAVFDSAGNLLVTDSNDNRIRKISPTGKISTLVGDGKCAFSGDGGPASKAEICAPNGMAIDGVGNIFVSDAGNSRIRRISPAGVIQTIAGNGTQGFCGDGGPALNACFLNPEGLAVQGNGINQLLFIADAANNRVRKVGLTSGIITTIAGVGTPGAAGDGGPATSAQLNNPSSVAMNDATGSLYISDLINGEIRVVNLNSGIINLFFGQVGCASDLNRLCSPQGLFLDSSGRLYVADAGNGRVLRVTSGQQNATILAGGTSGFNGDGLAATSTFLHFPNSALLDSRGALIILDSSNNRVRRTIGNGAVNTIAGGVIGDGKPGPNAALNGQFFDGLATGAAGQIFFADSYNNRVRTINVAGTISTVAGTGITGTSGDGGPAKLATLTDPVSVARDSASNTFIGSPDTGTIRKVDASGTISTFASNVFPYGMATDAQGNIYVAGFFTCTITKIAPNGVQTVIAGLQFFCGYGGDGGPATSAQLSNPIGVTVDRFGGIYIADWSNNRIRMIDVGGTIATIAGNGTCGFGGDGGAAVLATLCEPLGVAIDQHLNLFVADTFNLRVRQISGGVINTIAGTGTAGYNGDGLPALETNIFPDAVAVKPDGTVVVYDVTAQLLRQIK